MSSVSRSVRRGAPGNSRTVLLIDPTMCCVLLQQTDITAQFAAESTADVVLSGLADEKPNVFRQLHAGYV